MGLRLSCRTPPEEDPEEMECMVLVTIAQAQEQLAEGHLQLALQLLVK